MQVVCLYVTLEIFWGVFFGGFFRGVFLDFLGFCWGGGTSRVVEHCQFWEPDIVADADSDSADFCQPPKGMGTMCEVSVLPILDSGQTGMPCGTTKE